MSKTKTTTKRKRNASGGKSKSNTKRKFTPRTAIKSSPGSSPNVHMFKRSYDHPFTIGVADSTNGVVLNTDSKWMIVKLHTQFSKLPDFGEFKALFSQYQITSVNHRLVPYYSNNITASALDTTTEYQNAIPNYEIFSLPVNSSAQERDLSTYTGDAIDKYINQSQRKSRRLMPNKTQLFKTLNPKVVGYKGPLDKAAGNSMMQMEAPGWLQTDPAIAGMLNQTNVVHYGVTLLIRRVDGDAFPSELTSTRVASMGFRMENEVFFKTRKVQ